MPTSPLSLAEQLYLVLHYEPVGGELLRNGKVNGSESQALAAATLVELLDSETVDVATARRGKPETLVVEAGSTVAPEAVAVLAAQRKPRGITWALGNLGTSAPVVARLVALGFVVAETKPSAALLPDGVTALRGIRGSLDSVVLGSADELGEPDTSWTIAAILWAGKVWRNVYSVKERDEREAVADRLAFVADRVAGPRGSSLVITRLGEVSVSA
ncbi:hypothetical protein HD599_002259 [Conyzicola lurida]|uniref:Golgi phosphoprotein 3 GPP34 n=1 Tax=Conyzicola lurida TaxID=1172621 RepID=A0A841AQF8_9MICO|nr:GPP34 family phosphoprotein [Conyzicola lurida]MBB5843936.1 hypothetical protein [Conyzicola lurida]